MVITCVWKTLLFQIFSSKVKGVYTWELSNKHFFRVLLRVLNLFISLTAFFIFQGPMNFLGGSKRIAPEISGEFHFRSSREGQFALNGIGCQFRASGTTTSSRSPGGLHGKRCPSLGGLSNRIWQICPTALDAPKKKQLCTPSTTASESTRSGATSGSGLPASNLSSSSCSMLITS